MTAGSVSTPLIIPIMQTQSYRIKTNINTNTPVSIHSDTQGVQIFYTLDGSTPAALQRSGSASSKKYSEPVLLPAGRVSVKAVAISSDGRQSSIVTKVFSVELVEKNLKDDENVLQSQELGVSDELSRRPATSPKSPEPRMMGNVVPPTRPRFLSSRLAPPTSSDPSEPSKRSPSAKSEVMAQMNSTDASRICRETDFLRCARCFNFRPSDPFARFCPDCGAALPVIPEQRLPPAEGGQMVCCVFCNTVVPVNTHSCLICENSIRPQLRPGASRALQEHVVCVCCGSGNPVHISRCLICESRLQSAACLGNSASFVTSADSRKISCSKCKRLNNRDARYCDWCGSKTAPAASSVVCGRCGASGHPYAVHCTACGVFVEAPPTSSDIKVNIRGTVSKQQSTTTFLNGSWQAMPPSDPTDRKTKAAATIDQSTQTVGLYYPSATELQKAEQQRALQVCREVGARQLRPPLTAVSPGRGFWRKQLDHVCSHLRSYAQNNAPFRAVLGEPRLGRVVSAVIQEDPQEISVTISFLSAARKTEKQVGPAADIIKHSDGQTETLSSVTERSADSSRGSERHAAAVKTTKKATPTPQFQVKDVQLLKELAPGRGQVSVIQELLDQGADPSCCDSDGRPALTVAVVNGHHDVLPVLVQRGADVEAPSGPMKNTALHEAAGRTDLLQCLKVLLSCKASVRRRNTGGQTAYDVAVSSSCTDAISVLAAQTGLDLLGKLGKPKLNPDVF